MDKKAEREIKSGNASSYSFLVLNLKDTEFIGLLEMSNFTFDKIAVAKSEFVKLFFLFFKLKKWFHQILLILLYLQMCFWGEYAMQLYRCINRKEGWDTGVAGQAPSSQTVESLLRAPWPETPGTKIWQKEGSVISLHYKNAFNFFWSNTFGKVKNSTNISTTRHTKTGNGSKRNHIFGEKSFFWSTLTRMTLFLTSHQVDHGICEKTQIIRLTYKSYFRAWFCNKLVHFRV
jgi:hypothetical protein